MSASSDAKKDAERQVSDQLANQPKQEGVETEQSKEKRSQAEKELNDKKTAGASTTGDEKNH